MSLYELPIRRPVATCMLFLAIVLMGGLGLARMPVELFPALEGDRIYLDFFRITATPGTPSVEPSCYNRSKPWPCVNSQWLVWQ